MRNSLAVLALALACTFETTPDRLALDERIWISPRFSAAETEAILDAIDEWHQATGGAVDLRPEIGYGKPAIVPAELPGIEEPSGVNRMSDQENMRNAPTIPAPASRDERRATSVPECYLRICEALDILTGQPRDKEEPCSPSRS